MNEHARYAILVVVLCGAVTMAYRTYDPYLNIERYYFRRSRLEYGTIKIAHFIIFMSALLSARYLLQSLVQKQ
jgi:hypothetical protein